MKKKFYFLVFILTALVITSICIGRYNLSFTGVLEVLFTNSSQSVDRTLLFNIRLPRTFLVVISGGALALSGVVFQSLFKNPLVSPDVLGISSACSCGAIAAILLNINSKILMNGLTFIAGLLAVILVLNMARIIKGNKLISLIISGIIISSIASSIIMMLKYVADPYRDLPSIEFWIMGGFHGASWDQIIVIAPLIVASATILFLLKWRLKLLSLGDEEAKTLGVNVRLLRITTILCATVLVSTVVSVAGVVSWIGLIAPHIVKVYVSDDISKIMGLSILTGSILLLFSDIIARTVFPSELPISILTSFIGALFLFCLMIKDKRR